MGRHDNGWYQRTSPCDKHEAFKRTTTMTFTVTDRYAELVISYLARMLFDGHTSRDDKAYSRNTDSGLSAAVAHAYTCPTV